MAAGQQGALPKVIPLVYDELHRLAAAYMRRERADHTLQAAASVSDYSNYVWTCTLGPIS